MKMTSLRIVEENLNGTWIFVPEYSKVKKKWFSNKTYVVWEKFFFNRERHLCSFYILYNDERLKFKDISVAKHHVNLYAKRFLSNNVVWELDEDCKGGTK
jgi:hypothetical protein